MADNKVLISESILNDIGKSIQYKLNTKEQTPPRLMGKKVYDIPNIFINHYHDRIGEKGNFNFFNISISEVDE